MSLEMWVSLGTLLAVALALYTALTRHANTRFDAVDRRFDAVDARFDRLEARVEKLDDRVYAIGVGIKPLTDEAEARRHL